MTYEGVEYAIRAGLGRNEWVLLISFPDNVGGNPSVVNFSRAQNVDGKTQYCRDTMVTAMGAANIIRGQNPKSCVAVRDLQTGQLTVISTPATQHF